MKKKGFTLVELLAVIAVLAILVILVVPNAMKLFNNAKQRSFVNELKEIYKTAEAQYVKDSIKGGYGQVYVRSNAEECSNQLKLSGRTNLEYYIEFNGAGKVIKYYALDGTYQYGYQGDGLELEEVQDAAQISKITNGKYVSITCTSSHMSSPPPESEDDYLVVSSGTYPYDKFLRTTISRQNVEKVTFTNSLAGHSANGVDCWDATVGSNGKILSWATDEDNNGLYEITIGSNENIFLLNGDRLFAVMEKLISIDGLEYLDTSQTTNMSEMFYRSNKLTSLDLTHFDTSKVTDMTFMFGYWTNSHNGMKFTSLDGIENWDTSNVERMGGMFFSCAYLTSLDLSRWDTSKVTDMHWMFSATYSLTDLNISNFDTSNVTDMNGMFNECAFTSLDLSHFDTSNVTNMANMFAYSRKLVTLNLSGWDTSNVTDMSYMFRNCEKLETVDVSHFNTSKVTDSRDMFSSCYALESLDVSNFDTSNVTNMSYMFYGLKKVTTLDVSNFNTSKVTNMMSMFSGDSSLTTLDVSNFDISKVDSFDSMFRGCSNLTSLDLSGWDVSKVQFFDDMFDDCSNLTSLNISGWNTSEAIDMQDMFKSCSKLSSLDISGFNTSKVTNMSGMFNGCTSLTSLDVSNWNTSNVENMSTMFAGIRNVTTLDLSSFDTSNVTNMNQMFTNAVLLNTIYATDSFNVDNVENSWYMFYGCRNLRGQNGTTYSSSNVDHAYAHVDGGTSNPGYFTLKNN